jgi:hypothetical protein
VACEIAVTCPTTWTRSIALWLLAPMELCMYAIILKTKVLHTTAHLCFVLVENAVAMSMHW